MAVLSLPVIEHAAQHLLNALAFLVENADESLLGTRFGGPEKGPHGELVLPVDFQGFGLQNA